MCEALFLVSTDKGGETQVFFILLHYDYSNHIFDHGLHISNGGFAEEEYGLCSIDLLSRGTLTFSNNIQQGLTFTFFSPAKN